MSARAEVRKELYIPESRGKTVWVSQRYLGGGLRREETRFDQRLAADFHENFRRRTSGDNGRTWTDWEPGGDPPMQDGYTRMTLLFATTHDARTGLTLQSTLQRLSRGPKDEGVRAWWEEGRKAFFDHTFIQSSGDEGRTWSEPVQLRYEQGAAFDPKDWSAEGFLTTNEMYGGYGFAQRRDGTIVYPVCIPAMHRNEDGTTETVQGVRCMLGAWNASQRAYLWEASPDSITVPHRLSGRGLDEPVIAALANGDLMLSMRGATVCDGPDPWRGTVESPGRAWFSVSRDGGMTWGPVSDLRYETGEPFYVPAAMARFIRSAKTGKLYWVGNITPTPPNGDNPRYPLVLAEVEETIPALKKNSIVVIEDRDPARQAENVGFSNFSLLENRETLDLELIFPHFLEHGRLPDGQPDFSCNTWRYRVMLRG